jgi:hypothetical protein
MNPLVKLQVEVSVNNATKIIELNQIPKVTTKTHEVVSDAIGALSKPPTTHTIQNKIEAINKTCEKLQLAKKNATRDRLISVLMTAITTLLLAATILAAIGVFGAGNVAVGIGITAGFLYYTVGAVSNCHYLELDSNFVHSEPGAALAFTPMSIFIPMWCTFRREMRIQNELETQKNDLSKELQTALPKLKEYYQKNQKELLEKLETRLRKADKAYTDEKSNPVYNAVCHEQRRVLFHEANDALKEMRKAAEFYSSL